MDGEFVDLNGERYYAIRHVDDMAPFFVSVVSNVDHWLFASSTGGLTAGRVSPETALFSYSTVDKIHQSGHDTGPKTILRVSSGGREETWEPFNREHDHRFSVSRHLYKNLLGNKLCFEELNHDLGLEFRYTWATSDTFGFMRQCELANVGKQALSIEIVDGLQNVLPAGTPRFAQTNTSNLVDAYKWTELDESTGLAVFTLYSGITDRAEPSESLRANTVFCLGLDNATVLLSSEQLNRFRRGLPVTAEQQKRGIRGAYFASTRINLNAATHHQWQLVANIEQSQGDVVALQKQLVDPTGIAVALEDSVRDGSEKLARIMASSDANQSTAQEKVAVHHYANVLFNVLRGGYFYDQYNVPSRDFARTVKSFNVDVYARNKAFLAELPDELAFADLRQRVDAHGDMQLLRLCSEYLPITFGRRHGDPSRPWNQFAINLKDNLGDPLLSYEGNWRDIFQNWEALAFSYPEFVDNMIAKFVNASTIDGYNPYRITKEGIDWEVEEPENPWSYIGYWGDHQVIYLQKLLELSKQFHPGRLGQSLRSPLYCYANVPYRIRPFDQLLDNPKQTVDFDESLARTIEQRVTDLGADGKLVFDADGDIYRVNLMEKLLVTLLAKLGNLVVDNGIWLNTQRPEWNDANNALVGQGISMVTLYYLRRFVLFLQSLLTDETADVEVSAEVADWLANTAAALADLRPKLGAESLTPQQRLDSLRMLGEAASRHRETLYAAGRFSAKTDIGVPQIDALLDDALVAIDHSIEANRRDDGLYHAYSTLQVHGDGLHAEKLGPMLEGQVAALSAGALSPNTAADVIEALFASAIYRPDQRSFMLYPDRQLPRFLDKNRVPADAVKDIDLLGRMIERGDDRIIMVDSDGQHRFHADFANKGDLDARLNSLREDYGDDVDAARKRIHDLYERVFDHRAFTGRSGTMFGFEGLGCVYWHMVAKLLLAVQENYFAALETAADDATLRRLASLYYDVRNGLGFNKTPAEYGAFPTDPYSHTPGHGGARQPGMTGQVKEEILTRFGELGLRVNDARVQFQPRLLRSREFRTQSGELCYLNTAGEWQSVDVPANCLAFTWCQVPITYSLDENSSGSITVKYADGSERDVDGLSLPLDESAELFKRSGRIRQLVVTFPPQQLFEP
ncbi:MAG: hypothetical protein AAF351_08100 [Pseudomonadota bacterium]